MRSPLAPAGLREMAIMTLLFGGVSAGAFYWAGAGHAWAWPVAVLFLLVWAGGLAFFRDPERKTPSDAAIMVSAADGHVTEVTMLDSYPDIAGPATRIGIFLSVFDVHINRSPCSGVVRSVTYKPGKFLDARDADCGRLNEANMIVIEPDAPHQGPVVVRQVAGLIARRIICSVKPGDRVITGQRIGLIKFGSRTELIVPGHSLYKPDVSVGDRVYGALTVLAHRAQAAAVEKQSGTQRSAAPTAPGLGA